MKKVLLMLVVGAYLSISITSCSKCGTCAALSNVKFCAKDNQSAYDAAKATCEAAGETFK